MPLVTGAGVQTAHGSIAALGAGGALAAFDVEEGGGRGIRVAHLNDDGGLVASRTIEGSTGGSYPQVVALPDGSALVAWREADAGGPGIRVARVSGL